MKKQIRISDVKSKPLGQTCLFFLESFCCSSLSAACKPALTSHHTRVKLSADHQSVINTRVCFLLRLLTDVSEDQQLLTSPRPEGR